MEEEARPSKKPRGAAGSGLTAFALRTAKQLAHGAAADGGGKNRNLVFSPLSIYAALSLVAAGARGATLDELLALLGAPSGDELAEFARGVSERALADLSGSGGPLVAFACGVWHEKTLPLKPAYCADAVETYRAENQNQAVPAPRRQPCACAVHEQPFVPGRHGLRRVQAFKVLKLPYLPYQIPRRGCGSNRQQDQDEKLPRFSMCVFLPDANDGLPSLVDRMAASGPSFLWDHLPSVRVKVGEFWLPKFRLSFSAELDRVLKAMGVEAAFDELQVDLSDMLEGGVPLVVEQVFHKALIEVDEEGTVAAGFSAGSSRTLQCARRDVDFVADHPFAFFVVEEASGAVVFMGHVLDPTASSSD
ncbi:unnamed protein product [Urochloa humidicola]